MCKQKSPRKSVKDACTVPLMTWMAKWDLEKRGMRGRWHYQHREWVITPWPKTCTDCIIIFNTEWCIGTSVGLVGFPRDFYNVTGIFHQFWSGTTSCLEDKTWLIGFFKLNIFFHFTYSYMIHVYILICKRNIYKFQRDIL